MVNISSFWFKFRIYIYIYIYIYNVLIIIYTLIQGKQHFLKLYIGDQIYLIKYNRDIKVNFVILSYEYSMIDYFISLKMYYKLI